MEQRLLFILLGVFASLVYVSSKNCIDVDPNFANSWFGCLKNLSKEDQALVLGPPPEDNENIKCFALCFYSHIGYYQNGQFPVEQIKQLYRNLIPGNQALADEIYKWDREPLIKANQTVGNDCERAYSYYKSIDGQRIRGLMATMFCSFLEAAEALAKVQEAKSVVEKIVENVMDKLPFGHKQ